MQRTPPAKVKYVSAYLKTAPSTTPQEAMDARQQAHINELTEQLRTTEHMSKKLREELAQAQAQMKAERASALEQRLKEAQAWKAGTELTKAMFQVTQARLLLLLDVERRDVLSREDDVRKERLARARRDYHLLLFQERENELEERIIELHETLDVEREEREKGDQEYEGLRRRFEEVAGKYGKLKAKYSTLLAKGTEMQRDLEQSGAKRSEMEDHVSRLEEEVKNLKAEAATLKSSLKRETLRFEGIKNEKDELENATAELKRSNTDLKRQVDKWKNLENKEGTETEKLRKERITLEVKLRELESRLSEREQHLEDEIKSKAAKVERFRSRLQDYVVADKESREFIAQLEHRCEQLNLTMDTLREENLKLKAELSTAEQEIQIRNTVHREHGPSAHIIQEEPSPPPSPKPRTARKLKANAPKKRGRPKITTDEEDQPPKKKSTTKKAAGRPSTTSQRRDEEDEAEEEAKVKKKRKLKIFSSSQPSTFTWSFDSDKVTNGLDIPIELSPMKEGEPTISRAIFSSRTSSSFIK